MNMFLAYVFISLVKLLWPRYWFLDTSVVYAQAYKETNCFTSNLFKLNKSFFGMRYGSWTSKYAVGVGQGEDSQGQAKYSSYFKSLMGYFYYLNYHKIPVNNFMESLIKVWKPSDLDYVNGWKAIHSKTWKGAKYLWGIILLIILIVCYVWKSKRSKGRSWKSK